MYFEIGKRFDWSHVRYRRLKNRKTQQIKEQSFIHIIIYVCKPLYLAGIVFVSVQDYMAEADHCFSEFDCFTHPNSWFGGDMVYLSQKVTLPFPLFCNFFLG